MDRDAEILSGLLDLLYDTLDCRERWNDFLVKLCHHAGCEHASITVHDFENRAPAIAFSYGFDGKQIDEWNSYYGSRNPRFAELRDAVLKRGGLLVSANSFNSAPAILRNSEYGEHMHDWDLYHSLILLVQPGQQDFQALNLLRGKSDKPFAASGQTLMGRLAPHLRRVAQVQRNCQAMGAALQAGAVATERLDAAVVAVDERGGVVMMNRLAEAILESNRGLLVRGRKLLAWGASESSELERLVSSVAAPQTGRTNAASGAIRIHGSGSSPPLLVVATPFGPRRGALVFIYDPTARSGARGATLCGLFGLTPAESRLADLLYARLELKDVAEEMHITLETARFMLKSIFGKTGVGRQSELIKMLGKLPGQ